MVFLMSIYKEIFRKSIIGAASASTKKALIVTLVSIFFFMSSTFSQQMSLISIIKLNVSIQKGLTVLFFILGNNIINEKCINNQSYYSFKQVKYIWQNLKFLTST